MQDLRSRRLLLQCLAKIAGALAQLVEQPRVLDGDDGLIGEVLDERDLLLGEWADLLAINGDRTDQLVLLEHGDHEKGPNTSKFDGRDGM